MKVLVACEESQRVCTEFRRLGHEAYSCDVQEPSGGHPEWHILGDVLEVLNPSADRYFRYPFFDEDQKGISFETMDGEYHQFAGGWDLIIAHPPCTHLASSGAAWFARKIADGSQQKGIDFFMKIANAECQMIAIENPIGIMSSKWRKPDQIIHPWEFGDNACKSTCLWLKGLPILRKKVTERPQIEYHTWTAKDGKVKRQEMWYYKTRCLPGEERAKAASKTFPGIARAMAEQWGGNYDN